VDPKTVDHLRISARNRDLALALLDPIQAGLQPPPWEWIAVMVFYAAVHAVNAYLWESQSYRPANHGDRRFRIGSSPSLASCSLSYRTLEREGFNARYNETYSLVKQDARRLLDVHFRQVEATVMQALGQPAPVW
jgi:hypothetical protein